MRHLLSLILAPIMGAAVYLLTGIANSKYVQSAGETGTDHWTGLVIVLSALIGAGTVYGLMLLVRFSPLGLVLTGLAFMSIGSWAVFANDNFRDTMPDDVLGMDGAGYGTSAFSVLIGIPLAMTVFSPRRWRRWPNPVAAVAPSPAYTPPPVAPYSTSSDQSYPYGSSDSPVSPSYGAPSSSPPNSPGYGAPVSPAAPYGSDSGYPPPSGYPSSGETDSTRRL